MQLKFFKRKTRNYYSAPGFYKKLFDIGVPERYWYVTKKELSFVPILYEDEFDGQDYNVSHKKQEDFLSKLLKHKNPSGVVAVRSEPTADMALATSFYIAKELYKNNHKVQIHNMASGLRHMKITGDVLLLWNINSEDDKRRLQDVRDVIFQTQGILRIVAFAGDNPLRFFCEQLRYYPNMYLYSLGKYRKINSEE